MIKKLPKEKRNKVVLVWLFTLMAAAAWAFMILSWQLDAGHRAGQDLQRKRDQFASMTDRLNSADQIEQDMVAADQTLTGLETQMASGDVFSWVVNTVREFKGAYQVDLPQFSQVSVQDNTLLPKFPYRQASLTVAGSAYFQDLGLFIADFENHFRFARIINLNLEPASGSSADERDREKLNFKMDLVFLVKPN